MIAGFLRYLLVIFFIFSVMEKAGVSVLSLLNVNNKELSEKLFDEEEDASARAESKEVAAKEYWLHYATWQLPEPYLTGERLTFASAESSMPLAYFPSVPTPPPNPIV